MVRVLPLVLGVSAFAQFKVLPLIGQRRAVNPDWLWPFILSGGPVLVGMAVWAVQRHERVSGLAPIIHANILALSTFCVAGSALGAVIAGAPVLLGQILVALSASTCIALAIWPRFRSPEAAPRSAAPRGVRLLAALGFWLLAPGLFSFSLSAIAYLGRMVLGMDPRTPHVAAGFVSIAVSFALVIWVWQRARRQWPWVAA
jgi:hypothetical protein